MSKKVDEIIKSLKAMSILEINDLVKAVEKEFDIKASAMATSLDNNQAGEGLENKKESNEVKLILKSVGGNKVAVIKIAKEVTGLGLMDAKKLIETAPVDIKEKIKIEEANELAEKFKAVGAEMEIK